MNNKIYVTDIIFVFCLFNVIKYKNHSNKEKESGTE